MHPAHTAAAVASARSYLTPNAFFWALGRGKESGDPFQDRRFDISSLLADDEHAAGGAAAADVQHREFLCVLDLVVARGKRYLPMAIEHLAHSRRADWMTRADKPAARIDRQLAAELDHAFLDRLPR